MTLLHFPLHRARAQHRGLAPLLRLACAQLRARDAAPPAGPLIAQWRRSLASGRLECRWVRADAADEPPGRKRDDRSAPRALRRARPFRSAEARPDVRLPSLLAAAAGAVAPALVAQRL
ncbi:hypothetical protein J5226_02915 [Lysobacter sp. K5869]|uniref:hypothetical protein n=1 Tax=Lysobacter sp. K5869 TaxID=2820808 RepID=UPI001C064784|nr:hypothetical protein [Lysobacter sp. K5869]QWP77374.1 hypothetical protein J5226_02915 [Lysobacter sp. K5869]